jgi:hypothetical protein
VQLTVPAIRAAEPDTRRQAAAALTFQLLEAIDALIAETAAMAGVLASGASLA